MKRKAQNEVYHTNTITSRIFSIKFHHFQHFQPKFFYFIVVMMDFSVHYMKTKEKH